MRNPFRRWRWFGARVLVLALLALGTLGITPLRVGVFETVDDTTPSGARCRLAVPEKWNGQLLIIAHGYLPAGRPLFAGFDPMNYLYRELLADGWLVAATSYRRNGLLFQEAAADVEELRALVARRQGRDPEAVFVEGTSMGGFVAALLAENPPHPSYRGALGLGAALAIPAPPGVDVPPLTGRPRFPLLFLSNRDEAAGPRDYARRAAALSPPSSSPVAVWTVARDGHVNLNQQEVFAAFRALRDGVKTGTPVAPDRDATVDPPPLPETVRFAPDGRAATGKVLAVDLAFGNLTVDFRPADLARLGLRKGDTAALSFGGEGGEKGSSEVRVRLGTTFNDVPEGAWVCFPTADGYTLVCRNFADAAGSAGATVGNAVTVRRP